MREIKFKCWVGGVMCDDCSAQNAMQSGDVQPFINKSIKLHQKDKVMPRTNNMRLVNVSKVRKLAGGKKKLVTKEFLDHLEGVVAAEIEKLEVPSA